MPAPRPAPRSRAWLTAATVTVAVSFLVACAGTASAPAGGGDTETVTIVNRSFGDDITITAGSSVIFQNEDAFAHIVVQGSGGIAAPDPLFDEELGAMQSTAPILFDEPGTYEVTCLIHTSMQMTITVE